MRLLVEGEAMINDGTALVAYRVALVAAVEGTFSFGDAVLEFFTSAAGGVAIGVAIGWLSLQVIRRQSDEALSIFVSVITAYAAYIVAEEAARLRRAQRGRPPASSAAGTPHAALDAGTRLSGRRVLARDDVRARGAAVRAARAAGAGGGRGARRRPARAAGARRSRSP